MKKSEKEFITTLSDATMRLISYMELGESFVEAHYYSPEVVHIGELLKKIKKEVYQLAEYFEPAKFLIKRTEDSKQIYIKSPLEKMQEENFIKMVADYMNKKEN